MNSREQNFTDSIYCITIKTHFFIIQLEKEIKIMRTITILKAWLKKRQERMRRKTKNLKTSLTTILAIGSLQ